MAGFDLETRASPERRMEPGQEAPQPPVYPTYKLLGNLASSPPQGEVLAQGNKSPEQARRPRPTTTAADVISSRFTHPTVHSQAPNGSSEPPSPTRMADRRMPDSYMEEPIQVDMQQLNSARNDSASFPPRRPRSSKSQMQTWARVSSPIAEAPLAPQPLPEREEKAWLRLEKQLESVGPTTFFVADGVAAEHPFSARVEAARKLIGNHERVPPPPPSPPLPSLLSDALSPSRSQEQSPFLLPHPSRPLAASAPRPARRRPSLCRTARQVHQDITRPGAPPTQPGLVRLPGQEKAVNALLTETARRLLGRRPSSKARPERPANIVESAVWADAAVYLASRLHVSEEEVAGTPGHEGRRPDMSPAAGAAMRAVLAEMAQEKASEAVVDPTPLPWREAAQWQRLEAQQ